MSPDVIVSYDSRGVRTERPKRPHDNCGGLFDSHPDRDVSVCRVCKHEMYGERAFEVIDSEAPK